MIPEEVVRVERRGDCALLTLDRPAALNALSFGILRALAARLDEVAVGDARALIVTGAGPKAFCVGADIPELRGRDLMAQKRGAELGQAVFARLDALPMPSIAVISGFAFGGGLELALACSIRLCTPQAKMGLPEVKLGLIPGYGGTQRLPRVIGPARALEMILTGRSVGSEEALRIGLVTEIVEGDPVEAGLACASRFTAHSLPVMALARAAVARAATMPLAEGLAAEAELSTLAYRLEDAEEGMAAFVEKRQPMFRDR
jgi:enoyl-CoA hydratase